MAAKPRRLWTIGTVLLVLLAAPALQPRLLAFPHRASSGAVEVWAEAPINQARLNAIVADAHRRAATSPLYRAPEARRVFLTAGGWRWMWLAATSRGAFAINRPLTDHIVFNRSSLQGNAVWNGQRVGGRRTMGGTLAHEMCHGMERRKFGFLNYAAKPAWLREGYCDHVASESSLSDADYAALKAAGSAHRALPYYEGRRRVAEMLARNGDDVDVLFAGAN